jgi:hypothetical protein
MALPALLPIFQTRKMAEGLLYLPVTDNPIIGITGNFTQSPQSARKRNNQSRQSRARSNLGSPPGGPTIPKGSVLDIYYYWLSV